MNEYNTINSLLKMKYGYFININGGDETKPFEQLNWEGVYVGPAYQDRYLGRGVYTVHMQTSDEVSRIFDAELTNVGCVVHYLCLNGPNVMSVLESLYQNRIVNFYRAAKHVWSLKIISASAPASQRTEEFEAKMKEAFDLLFWKDEDEISYFYHSMYYYLVL